MKNLSLPEFQAFLHTHQPNRIWFLSRYQKGFNDLDALQVKLNFDRMEVYYPENMVVLCNHDQRMVFSHVSEISVHDDPLGIGEWVVLFVKDVKSGENSVFQLFLSA